MSNAYTGNLVLIASYALKRGTYEGMCESATGSPLFRVISEMSMVLLLFGTLSGDAALLADTGTKTLLHLQQWFDVPEWMIQDPRVAMIMLTGCLVVPLSFTKQMRSLERAAMAGVVLVLFLISIVIYAAIEAGMPALYNGELPILHIPEDTRRELPNAFSILSFAFYLQPMLLPLLSEMPSGKEGLTIMCHALRVVTLIIAFAAYVAIGFFGAARYGKSTEGDILLNQWLPDKYTGYLEAAVAVYLSISMAPIVITMRYVHRRHSYRCCGVLTQDRMRLRLGVTTVLSRTSRTCRYTLESVMRKGVFPSSQDIGTLSHAMYTLTSIILPTAIAALYPKQSAYLFAATGATGVLLISYILPITIHLILFFTHSWKTRIPQEDQLDQWLLEDAEHLEECSIGSHGPQLEDRRGSSVFAALPNSPQAQGLWAAAAYPSVNSIASSPSLISKMAIILHHVIVPVLVLILGVGSSVMAIIIAFHHQ